MRRERELAKAGNASGSCAALVLLAMALSPVQGAAPQVSSGSLTAPPAPSAAAIPDEDMVARTVADALTLAQAKDCKGALAKLDPLAARLPPGKPRQSVQLVRMTCLAPTGRDGEVAAVQHELELAAPDQPLVRAYGVTLALDRHDGTVAADRLTKFADEDSANLQMITGEGVREVLRLLGTAKDDARRDRLMIALARAEFRSDEQPDLVDRIDAGAIHALLGQQAVDDARVLLPRVDTPELLAEMAMVRAYAPLWPDIEARLGAASATAVDAYARDRLDAFARTPDDPVARRDAVRSFVLLWRLPEAVETAAPVKVADGMDDVAVETVTTAAEALAAEGQTAAAADRLRPFAALDPKRTPDALTGLITLAERLDENGQEADALTAARTAMSKGAVSLSPFGLGWLRRTEVCALSALGRTAEAKTAGDLLKAQAADNRAATIEGLLCAGRRDEAARLAIATLATPDGGEDLADQFQPAGALWAPADSRLRDLWTGLWAARPDVRAAFQRQARILPKSLWPARTPRPIPVAPSGPGEPTT